MKVSEESYRTYQDTQAGAISYVGSEDGMFYMDCFMEGMDEYLIDKLEVCEGDVSLLKDRSNRYIALITNFYKLAGEKEEVTAFGAALMNAGVQLSPNFAGVGFSEKSRYYPDFGSRMYFIEKKDG